MFYVKSQLNKDAVIKTALTKNNVFTRCPDCGEEFPVDLARLFRGMIDEKPTMEDAQVLCPKCTAELLEEEEDQKYIDSIRVGDALCTTARIAEDYDMTERELIDELLRLGILMPYQEHLKLSPEYAGLGYAQMHKCPHGVPVPLWTRKGRIFLYYTLKDAGFAPDMDEEAYLE